MMQKRVFSREFKLDVVRQIASGQKRPIQVRREYSLDESMLSRWCKEYRERGEDAFLPKEPGEKTQEYLEKKRAWDRSYYQRHKIQRQAANYGKRTKLFQYIQQIKANASCVYCGENHPATLQFHHRDPSQKEFNIGEFVPRRLGGIDKLKKEIEKCDIVCANCHLKQHYYLGRRQSRVTIEPIADQFARAEEELTPTQNEELAHAIVNNYFPEGIDFASLSDEFYDSPEQ
jgi:transposase-like protein